VNKFTQNGGLKKVNIRVAIIASNGGLFDAYKVFNIASVAAATDQGVTTFFTFEGLNLIYIKN